MDFHENKFWKLIKANATRHHGVYKCCPNDTYPSLRFYFIIERHAATLVTLLITPAIGLYKKLYFNFIKITLSYVIFFLNLQL